MTSDLSECTISREYRWEMGHRLPHHNGGCKNIHGHSYRMSVVLSGTTNDSGMLIDFYDLDKLIEPLVSELDHAFLCDENDDVMKEFFNKHPFKVAFISSVSTVENICRWLAGRIAEQLRDFGQISALRIRILETENSFAEVSMVL